MVFGNCGVLPEIGENKGFVEMTGIDPETSQDICDVCNNQHTIYFYYHHDLLIIYILYYSLLQAILSKGGRYLEAMIQGSKKDAEEGNLVCLAAGDKSLFTDCKSSFCAISNHSFYLGKINIDSFYKLL